MSELVFTEELRIKPPVPRGRLVTMVGEASDGVTDPEEAARVAEEVERELSKEIVVTLQVATLVGGYRRANFIQEAIRWVRSQYPEAREEDVVDALPEEVGIKFMVLRSAADVVGCIVPERCSGFTPPRKLLDWLEVPDYLMSEMLTAAWSLNPHWAGEFGAKN